MPYYIVWMHNKVSSKDDEPWKIKAKNEDDAREIVRHQVGFHRFLIGNAYTLPEFKKRDPWWHAHFWGRKARNE